MPRYTFGGVFLTIFSIFDRLVLKPEEIINIKFDEILLLKARVKYLGKLLNNKGIIISIKSLEMVNNTIFEGEGFINIEYNCELLVFCPENGDILFGKIISSNENGILVESDICKVFVSNKLLPDCSYYSKSENAWCWELIDKSFFYDIGEIVRVKIADVSITDIKSLEERIVKDGNKEINDKNTKIEANMITSGENVNINNNLSNLKDGKILPIDLMEIKGTFNQSGLGPVSWWN